MIKSRRPIFVVGTPRSGTTLTATLLGNHEDVFMPGECHFFELLAGTHPLEKVQADERDQLINRLLGIYRLYNQPADQARVDAIFRHSNNLKLLAGAAFSTGQLFDEFMQLQLAAQGAQRWGNQAPKDIFHVDKILTVFPDAHLVVCIRDCRDFLLSYKNRWRVSEHGARLQQLYHPVLTSMLWRTTMKQVARLEQRIPASQISLVRYEDLVGNPESTVARLCSELALDYDQALIAGVGHNSSTETSASGIFDSSVGRWREGLDVAEASVAQTVNGDLLRTFGYALEPLRSGLLRILAIWMSFPYGAIKALAANRDNRGPLVPYLLSRLR